MSEELVKKEKSFSDSLTADLLEIDSKHGLPVRYNIPKFVNNCLYLLNNNKNLADFSKINGGMAKIKAGMIRSAFVGLDFMSNEVYLIPYGNDLNFQISYKGATKLAKKYSIKPISVIYAEVVRQGDDIKYGTNENGQYIEYSPLPFNEGSIRGAFAEVVYSDGSRQYCVMTKAEIDKCRNASKTKGAVWSQWYEEMAKKTVLKRLCKSIDIDFDNAEQRVAFEEREDFAEEVEPEIVDDVYADCEVIESETVEVDE